MTDISNSMLMAYQNEITNLDEVLDIDGNIKPHWQQLFNNIDKMGLDELAVRSNEIILKLRENGVTYNIYDSSESTNRAWKLDPIPFLIEQKEWDEISKGLIQRAKVLDAIYKDFYGPQNLIKDGILPAHVLYGNDGFFPSCFDVKLPSENQLVIYATDFARGPDQQMWVLDSRTQSPSGSGYALENRSVLSKFLPELTEGMVLNRLSPFFNTFQHSIANLSPNKNGQPNIVYLTPGPNTETFFEHTYLASYLGYTLVQGDDLLVRNGFVWLKSLTGLEKVDVIIRRIDDEFCDPLELREDSHLGVPGLLQAIRMGNVVVLNPPGSSVLENHAILPFMNSACKYFFEEDLLMPNIATWWCGQAKELAFVMENLEKLIIKKANRKERHRSIFARTLSAEELALLRQQILAKPEDYVAQQECILSTAPSFVNGKIEPRFTATRAFLIYDGKDYQVMRGGLTRSSANRDRFVISNQLGGFAKDTWIVTDKDHQKTERVVVDSAKFNLQHEALPSRSAENLFWAGRYCERTHVTTKLIKIIINALHDNISMGGSPKSEDIGVLLRTLTELTSIKPGFEDEENHENPYKEMMNIITSPKELGSIHSTLKAFLRSVTAVNDKWNHDTRRYINAIENSLHEQIELSADAPNGILKGMERLQRRIFAYYGILAESFPRDMPFYLLESGKLIERILAQASIIKSVFNTKFDADIEKELIEAVLINQNLLVSYRQLYKSYVSLETALDMLLFDDTLPYSMTYLLGQLNENISKLPNTSYPERISESTRLVLDAHTKVRLARLEDLLMYDEDTLVRFNLELLLKSVFELISAVTDSLTNQYFSHAIMQHSLLKYPEENTLKGDEI